MSIKSIVVITLVESSIVGVVSIVDHMYSKLFPVIEDVASTLIVAGAHSASSLVAKLARGL